MRRVNNTGCRRYYRIVYNRGVTRKVCFCVANSLLEARRIARAFAPVLNMKESSIAPTSRDQVKKEYTWLNFSERGW